MNHHCSISSPLRRNNRPCCSYSSLVGSSTVTTISTLYLLLVLLSASISHAFEICPGIGLKSKKNVVEIVIFEHTNMGTGGLVHNCPTPLCLGNLPMPQFQHYKELPLMLGCGVCDEEGHPEDEEECSSSTVALGEVAPWFWLHNLPEIPGSYLLEGASGPLYMGGNIEDVTQWLMERQINPKGHIKFFRQYKIWQKGELEEEVQKGLWDVTAQDPIQALHPVMSSLRLP